MDTQIGALVVAAIIAAEWLGKFNLQMSCSWKSWAINFLKKVGGNEFHHVSSKGFIIIQKELFFFAGG